MLLLASVSLWWTIFSFTTVAIFLAFIYKFLIRTIPSVLNQLRRSGEISEVEIGQAGSRQEICGICQSRVPDRDHHCIWFDCCIGKHNQCLFIMALFFGMLALLYSSNLTLTSVCHPFTLYKTILLPDDCSDVLSLSFVAALYSLFLAFVLLFLLLQQILFVSLLGSHERMAKFTTDVKTMPRVDS
ncbi:hypothetical protein NQ318_017719 [Aromia moschata]|uniref:Palmitoyltransferase n=1 Tax=Aromia moschata TaxID=1265417 RepID=A0AAV8XQY3_9CUCU|nr:hypothetical protein NQ318_017719 [Aromia moschata]